MHWGIAAAGMVFVVLMAGMAALWNVGVQRERNRKLMEYLGENSKKRKWEGEE